MITDERRDCHVYRRLLSYRSLDSLANDVIRRLNNFQCRIVRSTPEQQAVATWPIGQTQIGDLN
jgi:hypothetical protein